VVRYDYRELVPLLRNRHSRTAEEVEQALNGNNDVRLSIDLRFQSRIAGILKRAVQEARVEKGSIVVLDPQSGDLLACASYPWPDDVAVLYAAGDEQRTDGDADALFDRARWGVYPPGSTFKIVTAIAALQKDPSLADQTFPCEDLGGRPGIKIKGYGRAVFDDESDRVHGDISMADGIVYSCNAYFAQLGVAVGSRDLIKTANQLGIEFAGSIEPRTMRDFLPWASFGQHPVLATPFQMARVAATIAAEGRMPFGRWVIGENNRRTKQPEMILGPDRAAEIAGAMRGVVTSGTADVLRGSAVQIAGKTGTAEVDRKQSHSWFIGFAPYQSARRRIAFAVLIENAGYGGRVAAPAAGRVVEAARDLGVIQ
jgi:cell division protein FtsI/penicillin-binding protein 2